MKETMEDKQIQSGREAQSGRGSEEESARDDTIATAVTDDSLARKIRQGQLRAGWIQQQQQSVGPSAAARAGVTADDSLERKIAQGQRFGKRAANPPSSTNHATISSDEPNKEPRSFANVSNLRASSKRQVQDASDDSLARKIRQGQLHDRRSQQTNHPTVVAASDTTDDSLARKIAQGQRLGRRAGGRDNSADLRAPGAAASANHSLSPSGVVPRPSLAASARPMPDVTDDSLTRKIRQGQLHERNSQQTSVSPVARTSVTADDSLERKIVQGSLRAGSTKRHAEAPATHRDQTRSTSDGPQPNMERETVCRIPDVTDDSLARKIRQGQLRNSRQENNAQPSDTLPEAPPEVRNEDALPPVSLPAPEIYPIEEPTPTRSDAGYMRLGESNAAAKSSILRAAPEIALTEEPVPHQSMSSAGNSRLGGSGSATMASSCSFDVPDTPRAEEHPPHQSRTRAERIRAIWRAQRQEPGPSHQEGRTGSAVERTSLPGAHRVYSTGVNPVDVESESAISESDRSENPNIQTGASVVTSDANGNPIVGFVPYEQQSSGANLETLVDGVRQYLQNNAPVADVVTSGEKNESKDVAVGWCGSRRRILVALMLLVAVAVAAPLAIALSSGSKSSNEESFGENAANDGGDAPTSVPSSTPTAVPSTLPSLRQSESPSATSAPSLSPTISGAPTSENWARLRTILSHANASTDASFSDAASPQSRALHWLAEEDFITTGYSQSLLAQNSTRRILVRYALAVLYFSTGGKESWRSRYQFLSGDTHECLWNSPYECAEDFPVGWVDSEGNDCAWYAQGYNCEHHGWNFYNNGYRAFEACCACKVKFFSYDMGVYCSTSDSGDPIVTDIILEDNGLTGTLPTEEIHLLKELERIWMRMNLLKGRIPFSFGHLYSLRHLDLHWNNLIGTLPSSMENLGELRSLDLSKNGLTGPIPEGIGSLSNLINLFLNENNMNGTIPSAIGNLANLGFFYCDQNQLSGQIPLSIGNLTSLKRLYLFSNLLSGNIPLSINRLHKLEHLFLDFNTLTGPMPLLEGSMLSLQHIRLSRNMITGLIQRQIGALSSLQILDAADNLLFGPLPSELGDLGSLVLLDVEFNSITGTLPSSLGGLSQLVGLQVSMNALSGTLPSIFENMKSLLVFDAHSNNFTGTILSELGKLQSLEILELGGNQLTGNIPSEFGESTRLHRFNVSNNFLNGTVPTTFVDLVNREDPYDFDDLLLHNNNLSGNFSFLCENKNEFLLIYADCGGSSPEVECPCCQLCCDRQGNCSPRQ